MKLRILTAFLSTLALATTSQAAEIKVLASAAVEEPFIELVPQFEKATGHKVVWAWAGSFDIQKRIAGGEAADLVILASGPADELIKQGKLTAGSRTNFAKSEIGVAVRAGAPKPDISTAEAVKKAVIAAKSVAYSGGASGAYIVSMFEKMGIADQVETKTATVKPGEPVGEVVARGDAELGFHQVSEFLPVKGIDYLGTLPPEIQNITVFAGGIHSEAKDAAATKALVDFLTAPSVATILKKHGLDPG